MKLSSSPSLARRDGGAPQAKGRGPGAGEPICSQFSRFQVAAKAKIWSLIGSRAATGPLAGLAPEMAPLARHLSCGAQLKLELETSGSSSREAERSHLELISCSFIPTLGPVGVARPSPPSRINSRRQRDHNLSRRPPSLRPNIARDRLL